MSLTSYRAAPSRVTNDCGRLCMKLGRPECKHVNGFFLAQVAKPGDDLLFHRLSDSTIGAVWFHGRVRDGIGWVTDAMATKLWDLRKEVLEIVHCYLVVSTVVRCAPDLSLMVGFIKRE